MRIQRAVLFLAFAALLSAGAVTAASAQTPTPTPTPNGEFLCSVPNSVAPDGKACNGDEDCAPKGVCVIAQPVCNGGVDDGAYCGCIGVDCLASGVCPSGPNATESCDVAANCSDGAPCVGARKVCLGGGSSLKGASCLNNAQCPGSVCRSTGKFCNGGDADSYSCVDDADCFGTAPTADGTCDAATVDTPVPTATKIPGVATPTRTATPKPTVATPVATGANTPTGTHPIATVPPTAIPTLTATIPAEGTTRLMRAISPSELTIPLLDASSLPTSGTVRIDSEMIFYRNKSSNVLTGVTRGAGGTTPAAHVLGSAVLFEAAAASPTPRATPAGPNNSGSISVTGKGGGCSLDEVPGSASGVWVMGAALVLVAVRRKHAQ